jgi:hypothetical protein
MDGSDAAGAKRQPGGDGEAPLLSCKVMGELFNISDAAKGDMA